MAKLSSLIVVGLLSLGGAAHAVDPWTVEPGNATSSFIMYCKGLPIANFVQIIAGDRSDLRTEYTGGIKAAGAAGETLESGTCAPAAVAFPPAWRGEFYIPADRHIFERKPPRFEYRTDANGAIVRTVLTTDKASAMQQTTMLMVENGAVSGRPNPHLSVYEGLVIAPGTSLRFARSYASVVSKDRAGCQRQCLTERRCRAVTYGVSSSLCTYYDDVDSAIADTDASSILASKVVFTP